MIATAQAIRRADPAAAVFCVGTPKGLETRVIPAAGLDLALVDPVPWPRGWSPAVAAVPVRLARAVGQARRLLRQRQADVVVGFGGYASLPVCLAARTARLPVVCHEANAVPGLANRVAARFAAFTAVTFPGSGLPREQVIGLPLRAAVADLDRAARRPAARAALGLPPTGPVLLASGGSQGAQRLNTAVVGALDGLLARGWTVLHATGPANFAAAPAPREDPATGARYQPVAYIDAMEEAYAAADLMLGRAGAATVVELAVVGLPAILVPLPHGNGEQAKNAAGLVAAGGAVLVPDAELDAARLVQTVAELAGPPGRLAAMAAAGPALMPRDAADRLAAAALTTARRP
jgi:UDP-N-acetylglucosamine--N-acetylmuramyl-(pentapeptide) pyrophosphoryl-undecaprenol N-acetylglucosamine transferase